MPTMNGRYRTNDANGQPMLARLATAVGPGDPGRAMGLRADGYAEPRQMPPVGITTELLAPGTHLLSIPNGNFEGGVVGWTLATTATGTAAIDGTAGNQVTGVNSLKLTCAASGDAASATTSLFPCGAGIPVRLGARAKVLSGAPTVAAAITYFDSTKTKLAGSPVVLASGLTFGAAFAEAIYPLMPPAGACYASVTYGISGPVGVLSLDELRFIRSAPLDLRLTEFGAYGDGATDCTAALTNALAVLAYLGGGTLVVEAPFYLNPSVATTIMIPASVELRFGPLGRFQLGAKAILTVVGRINAGSSWIFDTTTVSGGLVNTTTDCRTPLVYPEWWGANPAAGTNCQPAIQKAQSFSELFGGTMTLRSVIYPMAATLYMRSHSTITGSGGGANVAGEYPNQTVLDFTTAPSGAHGLVVTGTNAAGNAGTIFAPQVSGITIERTATDTAGSGSVGLFVQAAYNGQFRGIGVEGFDENVRLDKTAANPTIACTFYKLLTGNYATRALNCYEQTCNSFYDCTFVGNAVGNECVKIGGGITCDTTLFAHCILGNAGGKYPNIYVNIVGGIYHIFRDCDIETSLTAGIAVGMTQEYDESTPCLTVDNCWFNDCGMCVWSYGILCSMEIVNCPRMIADVAYSPNNFGVNTPGADACVKLNDSGGATRSKNIIIANNNMFSLRSDGSCIKLTQTLGAYVSGNRLKQSGNGPNNSCIQVGGVANLITNNRFHTGASNPVNDSGQNNYVVNNYGI